MKLNNIGATRVVIILDNYVIKIPKFWRWQNLLRGLLANINEGQTWRWNSGKYETGNSYLLCPVKFTSWGGWFLIMHKAVHIPHDLWHDLFHNGTALDAHIEHFQGDDSHKNYGFYNNRIVKVDYGDLDKAWGIDFRPNPKKDTRA